MRKQLHKYAKRHEIDFDQNLEDELGRFDHKGVPEWVSDVVDRPGIYHSTSIEGLIRWIGSGKVLKPHSAIAKDPNQLVENTHGNTCAEDVERGLDDFVFMSMGRVYLSHFSDPRAIIVMNKGILREGAVSVMSLEDHGSILQGPEERFMKHDEVEVKANNDKAFEEFKSTLVEGAKFGQLFAGFLASQYESLDDFLNSFSLPGNMGERMYCNPLLLAEQQARHAMIGSRDPEYLRGVQEVHRHGYYYFGPQLMIPGNISSKFIDRIVIWDPKQRHDNVVQYLKSEGLDVQTIGVDRYEEVYAGPALEHVEAVCADHEGDECSLQSKAQLSATVAMNTLVREAMLAD